GDCHRGDSAAVVGCNLRGLVGSKMFAFRLLPRHVLCTTVSVAALVAASPQVRGADLRYPVVAKALPIAVDPARCPWWGEGGAQQVFGGHSFSGNPAIDAGSGKSGWDAAAGFDCRFGPTPWHVSAQARYGAERNAASRTAQGTFFVPSGVTLPPPAPP